MNITIGKEELENIKLEYKKYLKEKSPTNKKSTIDTIWSDTFYAYNNDVGVNFWKSFEDEASLLDAHKNIEKYLINTKKRKDPIGDAKQYLRDMCIFRDFLDEKHPNFFTSMSSSESNDTNNNSNFIKRHTLNIIKQKNNVTSKKSVKKDNITIDDMIDNVVRVKIGLRILLGVLEPIVIIGLKNVFKNDWWKKGVIEGIKIDRKSDLIEEKLDITLCFTLLVNEKYWENIFKKKIKNEFNSKRVNSSIKGLKIDRNINAHDLLEDISNEEAELTLKQMSYLCNAFGEEKVTNKINRIINTINKNYE